MSKYNLKESIHTELKWVRGGQCDKLVLPVHSSEPKMKMKQREREIKLTLGLVMLLQLQVLTPSVPPLNR